MTSPEAGGGGVEEGQGSFGFPDGPPKGSVEEAMINFLKVRPRRRKRKKKKGRVGGGGAAAAAGKEGEEDEEARGGE